MKHNKIIGLSLFALTILMSGCGGTQTYIKTPEYTTSYHGEANQVLTAKSGEIIASITNGEKSEVMRLENRVSGSKFTVSCTLSPQLLEEVLEEANYTYYISKRDTAKVFMGGGLAHNQPCGIGVSKTNSKDVSFVVDIMSAKGCPQCGLMPLNFEEGSIPKIKIIPKINQYSSEFLRKTIKFEAFADDFLSIHYMEEKGEDGGYDINGNPVAVTPTVTERIFEFDIQESDIITVGGAKIQILEATPEQIKYKILQQMQAL